MEGFLSRRRPDRRIAVALSVIPGAGQLYNGQPGKAARLFVGSLGLMAASLAILLTAINGGPAVFNRYGIWFLCLALVSIGAFLTGFVTGLFLWASAFVDAHDSARRIADGAPAPTIAFFHL